MYICVDSYIHAHTHTHTLSSSKDYIRGCVSLYEITYVVVCPYIRSHMWLCVSI